METTRSASILTTRLVALMFIMSVTLGQGVASASSDAHSKFGNVTAAELATLAESGNATILDANSDWFRKQNGVIPGAKLLTSYSKYDINAELPESKDAKLIFYCSNTYCTAAPRAAQIAKGAGYTDVNVLPTGLMGWIEAGFEVEKL